MLGFSQDLEIFIKTNLKTQNLFLNLENKRNLNFFLNVKRLMKGVSLGIYILAFNRIWTLSFDNF